MCSKSYEIKMKKIEEKKKKIYYKYNQEFMKGQDSLYLPSISNSQYHSGPGLSKSDLSLVGKSINHYLNGFEIKKQTKEMLLGTMVHTLVLEPEQFFLYVPDTMNPTPEDRIPVPEEFLQKAYEIAANVYSNPEAARLLSRESDAVAECSFYSSFGGMILRARPDLFRESENIIVDLKTCYSAAPEDFGRAAGNFDYYIQHPYYVDVVGAYTETAPDFVFVAVETSPPFNCSVYRLESKYVDMGRRKYLNLLKKLREGLDNPESYMGYSAHIEPLALPGWMMRRK